MRMSFLSQIIITSLFFIKFSTAIKDVISVVGEKDVDYIGAITGNPQIMISDGILGGYGIIFARIAWNKQNIANFVVTTYEMASMVQVDSKTTPLSNAYNLSLLTNGTASGYIECGFNFPRIVCEVKLPFDTAISIGYKTLVVYYNVDSAGQLTHSLTTNTIKTMGKNCNCEKVVVLEDVSYFYHESTAYDCSSINKIHLGSWNFTNEIYYSEIKHIYSPGIQPVSFKDQLYFARVNTLSGYSVEIEIHDDVDLNNPKNTIYSSTDPIHLLNSVLMGSMGDYFYLLYIFSHESQFYIFEHGTSFEYVRDVSASSFMTSANSNPFYFGGLLDGEIICSIEKNRDITCNTWKGTMDNEDRLLEILSSDQEIWNELNSEYTDIKLLTELIISEGADVPIYTIYIQAKNVNISSSKITILKNEFSLCPAGKDGKASELGVCTDCGFVDYEYLGGEYSSQTYVSRAGDECALESTFGSCEKGYYKTFFNDTREFTNHMYIVCQPCPNGTYDLFPYDVDDCTKCPQGTYGKENTVLVHVTDCEECKAGTYGIIEGGISANKSCEECSEDEICPRGGYKPYKKSDFVDFTEFNRVFMDKFNNFAFMSNYWTVGNILKIVFLFVVTIAGIIILFILLGISPINKELLGFQHYDLFFKKKHIYEDGKSVISKKTILGSVLSIIAIIIGVIFIIFTLIDYFGNNKIVVHSSQLYQGNDIKEDFSGDFMFDIFYSGNFESSEDCVAEWIEKDYVMIDEKYSLKGMKNMNVTTSLGELDGDEGCSIVYECFNCSFLLRENNLKLRIETQFKSIPIFRYKFSVPHYNTDSQNTIEVKIHSKNESINSIEIGIKISQNWYKEWLSSNYFSMILGYEYYYTKKGLITTIDDYTRNVGDRQRILEVDFDISLTDMIYVAQEERRQSILNMFAQVFALFALSVAVLGIIFMIVSGILQKSGLIKIESPLSHLRGKSQRTSSSFELEENKY